MQYFTFNLAVKAYIKKFLENQHGSPIIASLDTDIGFVIINVLSSKIQSQVTKGIYLDMLPNRYNQQITFRIPFHYWSLTKKEISPQTAVLLNRYFENKFKEELNKFILLHEDTGIKGYGMNKSCLEKFALKHGIEIEEDISFDTLKKIAYRHRKKNIEKLSCNLSRLQNLFTESAIA